MKPTAWRRRLTNKFLLLVAASVSVLALVMLFSPSSNVWLQAKHELEGRGEVLDWEKFIPPEIPEAQNLFADPVAAILLPVKGAPIPPNPHNVPALAFPPGSADLGYPFAIATLKHLPREANTKTNLASLDQWFEQWDQSFAHLREAGKRPGARLPGRYNNPSESPILSFVQIRLLSQVLASRAKVHLLKGDSAAALEDLDTLSVVIRALETMPGTLLSAMIQVAVSGLYLDTVEEGLRENLWHDAELKELTSRLMRMNLLAAVQEGIRGERAAVGRHFSALANRGKDPLYAMTVRDVFTGPSKEWSFDRFFLRVTPAGWVRRNQAHHARVLQSYIDAFDPAVGGVDLNRIHQANAALNRLTARWSPNTTLLMRVTPSFPRAAVTVVRTQTRARQAALACAIQRFHAQRNRHPDNLVELVPNYLEAIPSDLFTRKPMTYRKTSHGWELSSTSADPTNPKGVPLVFIWNK
jgi:hypothetical protein